jgi:hypothetical protein
VLHIPGGPLEKIDEATWRHAWELKVFGYIKTLTAMTLFKSMRDRANMTGTMLPRTIVPKMLELRLFGSLV